jgi:hypothetical protein
MTASLGLSGKPPKKDEALKKETVWDLAMRPVPTIPILSSGVSLFADSAVRVA